MKPPKAKHLTFEDRIVSIIDDVLHLWFAFVRVVAKLSRPFTSKVLSRRPHPPLVTVKDIRANRIKLEFAPRLSSPFNVEEYEVEFQDFSPNPSPDTWQSIGKMDLGFRTVARLKPGKKYSFRVRAINHKGISQWSEPISESTKLDPVDGGSGAHEGFIWTQNLTDVCFTLEVPQGTTKRDLSISLKQQQLEVAVQEQGGTRALLQGELPHPVKPFLSGSHWEMVKDKHTTVLSITLEKKTPSIAPKFDYWRSCFVGFPEIDTHKIESDPNSSPIIPANTLTPAQMAQLGVRA